MFIYKHVLNYDYVRNIVVRLVVEWRSDGESERWAYKAKTWATYLEQLACNRGMDGFIFVHQSKVPDVS